MMEVHRCPDHTKTCYPRKTEADEHEGKHQKEQDSTDDIGKAPAQRLCPKRSPCACACAGSVAALELNKESDQQVLQRMKGRDQDPESRKHRAGDKPDELSSGGQQHDRRQQAPLAEAPGEGVTTEENAADHHNHLSAPIEPVWEYKRRNRETIEVNQAVMHRTLLDADQAADKS